MVGAIFYKGTDPLAKAIRWWTGGTFSHCGILLWRCLVIDIDGIHGVRARFDPWRCGDVTVIPIDRDPVKLLHQLYMSRWIQYSWKEGLRKKLPWIPDDGIRWNCAEMVYDVLFPGGSDSCLYPDDVYRIMKGGDVNGNSSSTTCV